MQYAFGYDKCCFYKISCIYDIAVIDNDFYKSSSSGKKNVFVYVCCVYNIIIYHIYNLIIIIKEVL
jgi:hypothetical protein